LTGDLDGVRPDYAQPSDKDVDVAIDDEGRSRIPCVGDSEDPHPALPTTDLVWQNLM